VGADRLLNAIAAYARTRKATIVVDVGTTITVDLVSERGNFCGGAIAPGPSTMMAALHEHTELLPAVTFDRPSSPLGRNTAAAMRSGAYWGTVGLVERLVSEMAREATGGPPVIFTGGAAEFVAREMKTKIELIPALTLEGLAILAAKA
jgi:type III pantothenate kinase